MLLIKGLNADNKSFAL